MPHWTTSALPAVTRGLAFGACALAALATSAAVAQTPDPAVGFGVASEQGGGPADARASPAPLAGPLEAVPAPTAIPRKRTTGILPAFIYGNGLFDAEKPDFVATFRGGVRFAPAYFGSTTIRSGPDAGFRLDHVELPGGITLGSNDTVGFLSGFGPRLAARYIRARNSDDYAEIRGLDDVPFSLELGFGLGYEKRNYRAFADVRYGVIGHNSWVGDIGADGITYPYEGLTLTLGPRVSFGSQHFMDTYFGISAPESEASGLAAYEPEAGIYGAGVEFGARYLFNERWGIEGAARWTKLSSSAARSPIVENGTDDQYIVRFDLSRRISLDF
jgi:outer membrane scaffolding protein for murein synthesis (MipA/OmpV family)